MSSIPGSPAIARSARRRLKALSPTLPPSASTIRARPSSSSLADGWAAALSVLKMSSAARFSATSCTRSTEAPRMSAIVSAASVPGRRLSTSAPVIRPMNDLRESPTRTGAPKRRKRSRFQMQEWFCSGVLPKPTPGSSSMRPNGTPAPAARLSERSKKRSTSSRMSIVPSARSRLCMTTTAEPVSATASAMPGSRCKPQTSLMTEAPSRAASRATAALPVSMEIGGVEALAPAPRAPA